MLSVENLRVEFPGLEENGNEHSFKLDAGSVIGITGSSGSGKTSLLLAIGGMLNHLAPAARVQGKIELCGHLLSQAESRSDVALVIENPYSQCSGMKETVEEELVLPLEARGCDLRTMATACRFFSSSVDIGHILGSEIEWLSGGELQRLHLGASLMARPRLLLLDQALTELDPGSRSGLLRFFALYAQINESIVILTFSENEVQEDLFDLTIDLSKYREVDFQGSDCAPITTFPSGAPVLSIRNLSFRYSDSAPELFQNLTFDLRKRELLFLLGPNGSGKSTLAKLLLGILPDHQQCISIEGKPISRVHAPPPTQVNCAFQNPDTYFCRTTVEDELEFGSSETVISPWFSDLLDVLDLKCHFKANPFDLNRSTRKRLSLALAARSAPSLLFLDEPSQYQDSNGVQRVSTAIQILLKQQTAVICATHDERLLAYNAAARRVMLPASAERHSRAERNRLPLPELSANRPSAGSSEREILRRWIMGYWRQIDRNWIAAIPDVFSYWTSAVYPKLGAALTRLQLPSEMVYVDIGCGLGWHTVMLVQKLRTLGHSCEATLGVDIQHKMLDHARLFFENRPNLVFALADATVRESVLEVCHSHLPTLPHLITSFYVLHDEPNFKDLLDNVYESLADGGYFLAVLLHPDSVELTRAAGKMEVITLGEAAKNGFDGRQWDWVGLYPVIRDGRPPLTLPYFHRSLSTYIQSFSASGFEVIESSTLVLDNNYPQSLTESLSKVFGAAPTVKTNETRVHCASLLIVARKPLNGAKT